MNEQKDVTDLVDQFIDDLPDKLSPTAIIFIVAKFVSSYVQDPEQISAVMHVAEQAIAHTAQKSKQH